MHPAGKQIKAPREGGFKQNHLGFDENQSCRPNRSVHMTSILGLWHGVLYGFFLIAHGCITEVLGPGHAPDIGLHVLDVLDLKVGVIRRMNSRFVNDAVLFF